MIPTSLAPHRVNQVTCTATKIVHLARRRLLLAAHDSRRDNCALCVFGRQRWRFFSTESSSSSSSSSSVATSIQQRFNQLRDPSLRGIGQVVFLNTSQLGAIVLGSLAIGDPFLAALAATGSFTSSMTSNLMGNHNKPATESGLHSYNGCLVGCASAVFIAPHSSITTTVTIALTGAAASTVVTGALSSMLKTPQFTYAFNIVTLTMLLRSQPLRPDSNISSTITTTVPHAIDAATITTTTTTTILSLLTAPLKGLSQIFVLESTLSGMGIAVALFAYSPMLAGHALAGSTIGCLTGWIVGTSSADIAAGIWGFNPALTSMGVGVFFVHNRASIMLSASGAFASACVFAAIQPVFGALYSPCLTLPFCVTMSVIYQLPRSVPALMLSRKPHSPERNTVLI